MKRKLFRDYGFWLLMATNAYLILYYLKFPGSINDIIILFWIQSVFIGVFNFFDMLTLRRSASSENLVNRPGCLPWFFLVHYGAFHLAYLFFLATIVDIKKIDIRFIEMSFFLILITCAANFIQNKIRNRTEDVNISAMFFMPYARIIPMHLMILLPHFFNIPIAAIFLVLKMFADVIMYFVYTNIIFRRVKNN